MFDRRRTRDRDPEPTTCAGAMSAHDDRSPVGRYYEPLTGRLHVACKACRDAVEAFGVTLAPERRA